jgi:hypothetical protein
MKSREGGENCIMRSSVVCRDSSPNIIRVIKSRRMIWAGHLARMGRWEMHTRFRLERLKGGNHSEDLDVDVGVILK